MRRLLLFTALLYIRVSAEQFHVDSPLLQYFQNANARRAFMRVWGGEMHPLEAALAVHKNINETSGTPYISSLARCIADVRRVLTASGSDIRAFKMVDSSVKTPVGILSATFTHLGNWDECVEVRDLNSVYPVDNVFHGQMCLTTFKIQKKVSGNKQDNFYDDPQVSLHTERNAQAALLFSSGITLGLCVPSSCSASHVQLLFSNVANALFPSVGNMHLVAKVDDSDCTTQDRPPFDVSDWVGVAVISCLVVVLILSTAYDILIPLDRKRPIGVAFSVISNGRKLLAVPHSRGDQTLSCLHGIRVLSMCWVVLGHRYLNSVVVPILNPMSLLDFMKSWYHTGIMNATVSVDTFFAMSGLLVGYLFFKQPSSLRRLNLPMYYIHRYIRLTPPFAVMMLLIATVGSKIGWGPLWEKTMNPEREVCNKNWWNSLLYINNYVDPQNQCGPTWYLMVDMQLHWLAPLVLLPMARWPRWSKAIIAPLTIAGLVINFLISYLEDLPGNKMTAFDHDKTIFYVKYFYVPTYTRFLPYLEGIVVGYIMANERAEGKKPEHLNSFVNLLAWISVAGLMLVPLMTGYDFILPPKPSKFWTAIYNSVHRPTWSLGVLGVVYLCASGNGRAVNNFLSWWVFQILGRITYCVYLLHMFVMHVQAGSMRTSLYIADGPILTQYAGDLVTSFILAGILSITCESPFLALEKELLSGSKKKTNIRQDVTVPRVSNEQSDKQHTETPANFSETSSANQLPQV